MAADDTKGSVDGQTMAEWPKNLSLNQNHLPLQCWISENLLVTVA